MAKFCDDDPYKFTVALHKRHARNNELNIHTREWREYTFRWDSSTVYYRNPTTKNDASVLAMVIDRKTLHMTPLDKAVIPPPMYASSLEFPTPVIGVATRPSFYDEPQSCGDGVEFVVATSDGKLSLLKGFGGNGASLTPGFCPPTIMTTIDSPTCLSSSEVDIISEPEGLLLRDIITIIDLNDDSLICVAVSSSNAARHRLNNNQPGGIL